MVGRGCGMWMCVATFTFWRRYGMGKQFIFKWAGHRVVLALPVFGNKLTMIGKLRSASPAF